MTLRTLTAWTALAASLAACGGDFGEADLIGGIGAFTFGDDGSAYHNVEITGEQVFTHVIFVDREVDCLDMDWTTNNYFFDAGTVSFDFAAVHFIWSSDLELTTYSLIAGDGPVDGWAIVAEDVPANEEKEVEADTSKEGNVVITSFDEDSVVGTFQALFDDGNVEGSFETTGCRNVL